MPCSYASLQFRPRLPPTQILSPLTTTSRWVSYFRNHDCSKHQKKEWVWLLQSCYHLRESCCTTMLGCTLLQVVSRPSCPSRCLRNPRIFSLLKNVPKPRCFSPCDNSCECLRAARLFVPRMIHRLFKGQQLRRLMCLTTLLLPDLQAT